MKTRYSVKRGCRFCGTCISECLAGAIRMTTSGAIIDQEKCTGCGRCYKNCASEAIEQLVALDVKTYEKPKSDIS